MCGHAQEGVTGEGGESEVFKEGAGAGVVFANVGVDAGDARSLQVSQKGFNECRTDMAGAVGGG